MENGDHEGAMRTFKIAREKPRHHSSEALSLVSLVGLLNFAQQRIEIALNLFQITGWKFNDLDIMIQVRFCEALYDVGRTSEADDSLLDIINNVNKEVFVRESVTRSVCSELCSTSWSDMHSNSPNSTLASISLHSQTTSRRQRHGEFFRDTRVSRRRGNACRAT